MDINPLQLAFGLLLLFFLPGYLLVKALFPGKNELDKEYNIIYEIGLGMGLSIVIAILDGFMLGSFHQFNFSYIVASLLLICLLLFIAAWYRGAFPWMGRLHPGLARVPSSERPKARKERMDGLIIKIWELSRQRERLRRELKDSERKSRAHGPDMRSYYRKKLEDTRARLGKIDAEIKELEDRRAEELAGVEEEMRRKKEEKGGRREARARLRKKDDGPGPAPADEAPAPSSEGAGPPVGLEDESPDTPESGAPAEGKMSMEEE